MSRQDQWTTHVSYEEVPGSGKYTKIPDPWDKFDGGDATSTETKYRSGGMGAEVALGGPQSVGNVTVERLYLSNRDHPLAKRIAPLRGRSGVRVVRYPLDADGVPNGEPLIYTGRLMTVNFPSSDANSNGASVWQLVVSTNGSLG